MRHMRQSHVCVTVSDRWIKDRERLEYWNIYRDGRMEAKCKEDAELKNNEL